MLATEAGIVAKNLTKPRQIQTNTETKKNLRLLFGQETFPQSSLACPLRSKGQKLSSRLFWKAERFDVISFCKRFRSLRRNEFSNSTTLMNPILPILCLRRKNLACQRQEIEEGDWRPESHNAIRFRAPPAHYWWMILERGVSSIPCSSICPILPRLIYGFEMLF